MGRPTKYTEELANEICTQIAHSTKGLNSIAKSLGINPDTVYEWLNKYKDFSENYARARELQADFLADEVIRVAKTQRIGKKTVSKEWGEETTTGDAVDRSRLIVDALKWKASKLAPKKYGDKVDVTSNGETVKQVFQINGVDIEF
jgi:transposase-like protein